MNAIESGEDISGKSKNGDGCETGCSCKSFGASRATPFFRRQTYPPSRVAIVSHPAPRFFARPDSGFTRTDCRPLRTNDVSSNRDPIPEDDPALREALKRCSPATYYAACKFRASGRSEDLRTLVIGVIERFVERELRPKLNQASDTLRLREDLAIDSLTMMEVVMIAEEVLRINVSNEELTQLRTLADVHAFILTKTSKPSPPSADRKSPADHGAWDLTVVGEEVRRIEARAATSLPRVTN